MRENLESAWDFICLAEGNKITNDPKDKGGLTARYGLTMRTMRALKLDLDHDGDVDAQDVVLVDKMVALAAFKKYYWSLIHGDDLPGGIDLICADVAWNSGPGKANQFLKEGHKSIDALTFRRKLFYLNLIERDPSQERFKRGWLNRADAALEAAKNCVGVK